jgi:NADPH2:quinone reductase
LLTVAQSTAVRIHQTGGPEELRFEAIDVGSPGREEVRVRHTAVGLNFTDIHHRTGRYPGPGMPLILGMEAVGLVDEAGSDVNDLKVGDRVAYAGASPSLPPGAYCQLRIMAPGQLVPVPDWLDDETAAAVTLKGLTAQYLLFGAYALRAGDAVLIHAAAGGVGLIMCQWARHLGAFVIGSVSSDEKAALVREHGCHHAIVSTREDVAARTREFTGGRGVDVVYDSVGASTFESSLASVRRRGTIVLFGSSSGPVPPFDLFRLNRMGSLRVVGAGLADYIAERSELLERATAVFEAVRNGIVKVRIHQRYPLAEAARAHRELEARRTSGSSILLP